MKNFILAVSALILILVVMFFLTKSGKQTKDTFIPTPTPLPSPELNFLRNKEATSAVTRKIYNQPPPVLSAAQIKGKKVRIKTDRGDIIFELFEDAPLASSNFIFLVSEKFYDGLIFHRREENFVIQGGDPLGNGSGGPGYAFADEPVTSEYERAIVAMANAGPNTNGSQFFIMLTDTPNLPKRYTIFGKVITGMEVVDKIKIGDVMQKVTLE